MNAYYEGEKSFWDRKGASDYVSLSDFDQQRLRDWIGPIGDGMCLDLGGGSGMMARTLDREERGHFVCLDISHAMLRHSGRASVQADALRLPFADGSFSLIVAAAFLHHLPGEEAKIFSECRRILAPGGRIVGYDPSADCWQNKIFMQHGPLRLKTFSPDERPIIPARLAQIAAETGFEQMRLRLFSFRNQRLTPFEMVQRFVLNPLAVGPLGARLHRWFYWEARKAA